MAFSLVVAVLPAFVPAPMLPSLSPVAVRAPAVQLKLPSEEIKEGFKTGMIAAAGGSFISVPMMASRILATHGSLQKWEWATASLFIELVMFGGVFRFANRWDDNDTLKQILVVAFSVFRAFSATSVGKKIDN